MVVFDDTEAAAVIGDGESLIPVSSQDTELAALKVQDHEAVILKLLFNAKSFSDKSIAETVSSRCYKRSTDKQVKIRMRPTSNGLELTSGHTRNYACKMIKILIWRDLEFDAMEELAKSVLDLGDDTSANGGDNDSCEYDDFSCTEEVVEGNAEKALTLQETKSQAYYALSMDCATIANFRGKLTEKILKEQDRYVKHIVGSEISVSSRCYKRSTDGKVKIRMRPTSNGLELTSGHTRSYACKMIKMLISRDSDFDAMEELVKSFLDPCDDTSANDGDNDSCEYDDFSCTEEMVERSAEKELTLQDTKSQAYYALSMDCATIANFRGKLTEKILKERDRYVKHIDSEISAIGSILCTNPNAKKYWSIDSGASNHLTGKSEWIKNVRPIPEGKKMCLLNANNKLVRVSGVGDIFGPEIRLYNVYLSDDLEVDELYVSIGQLTGEGYTVLIDKGEVTIRLAENYNHIVGTGSLDKTAKVYVPKFFNGSVLEKGKGKGKVDENQGSEYKIAPGEWVLDSGCHNHLTCRKPFLNKKWKMRKGKKFGVAGSEKLSCKVKGNITEGEVRLKDVYFCQDSRSNIISVCQLDVLGYNFFFSRNHCHIRYKKEENLVGLAHADGGNLNYYVEFLHSKE